MLNMKEDSEMAAAAGYAMPGNQKSDTASNTAVERLNFNVSASVAAEVRQLAAELDMPMTQLFKYAMSIFKIAVLEARRHRKLVIADENGTVLREFVLPGLNS